MVRSREIFDSYIMKELLACSHVSVLVSCPWVPAHVLGLEGKEGPCMGCLAASVLSSPFQRMLLSTSRATW